MPADDIRALSEARYEHADECLHAAKSLLHGGDYKSAANRAYYAIFHAMRAVFAYPVMYTPEFAEYYIYRAFDGSESLSGIPFVDGRCPAQDDKPGLISFRLIVFIGWGSATNISRFQFPSLSRLERLFFSSAAVIPIAVQRRCGIQLAI